jgi:hypothetical protein
MHVDSVMVDGVHSGWHGVVLSCKHGQDADRIHVHMSLCVYRLIKSKSLILSDVEAAADGVQLLTASWRRSNQGVGKTEINHD